MLRVGGVSAHFGAPALPIRLRLSPLGFGKVRLRQGLGALGARPPLARRQLARPAEPVGLGPPRRESGTDLVTCRISSKPGRCRPDTRGRWRNPTAPSKTRSAPSTRRTCNSRERCTRGAARHPIPTPPLEVGARLEAPHLRQSRTLHVRQSRSSPRRSPPSGSKSSRASTYCTSCTPAWPEPCGECWQWSRRRNNRLKDPPTRCVTPYLRHDAVANQVLTSSPPRVSTCSQKQGICSHDESNPSRTSRWKPAMGSP